MYIRRTTTTSSKTGDPYFTYRLVESVRTPTGVRQITVLNLGSDFSYARELWPDIAGRIDELLHGEMRLFDLPKDIEAAAQHYAAKIIRVRNSSIEKHAYSDAEPEYHTVDINSLQTLRPRTVSIEHVCYYAARQLELDNILNELGLSPHDKNAVLGVIIGRMVEPGSELATHFWLQNQTGLGEIIGCDYQEISLARIYRSADLLVRHKEVLEQHLYNRQKFLFKFGETITLYDLTNTYFEGSGKFNTLAGRGHSKEKRTDCPLVAFGLILDGSGFPKRSEVFEGNISEPKTLEKMIKSLQNKSLNETNEEKQQPLLANSNPVIVMDAGIATEENVQWLKTNNYPYLVVSRKQHLEFYDEKSVVVKNGVDSTVKVYKVVNAETNEIELYCHSTGREAKEKGIQNRFTTRFEEELQKLALGLTKKGCVKKYDKVNVKLGRLKEKYSKAARFC